MPARDAHDCRDGTIDRSDVVRFAGLRGDEGARRVAGFIVEGRVLDQLRYQIDVALGMIGGEQRYPIARDPRYVHCHHRTTLGHDLAAGDPARDRKGIEEHIEYMAPDMAVDI